MKVNPKHLLSAYWRVHWPDLPPFNRRNARSRDWGTYETDEEREQLGYSAMQSPSSLVEYFNQRTPIGDDFPIVVFSGEVVGVGSDGEDLVLPTGVIAWITGADLDNGILEHEDDPEALAETLGLLGRSRRIR